MKWFRMWNDIIDDPKCNVSNMPYETFHLFVSLMAYASELEKNGFIHNEDDPAWRLRISNEKLKKHLKILINLEIITQDKNGISFKNWNKRQFSSDKSTDRVKRFRNGKRNVSETVNETPPETDTETDTETELNTGTNPSGCRPETPKDRKKGKGKNVYSTAVAAYRDIFKLTPKPDERQIIDRIVIGEHSVAKWSEILTQWKGRKYGPFNIAGMLQVFKRGWIGEEPKTPTGTNAVLEWAKKEGVNLNGDQTDVGQSDADIEPGILG